MNKRALYDIVKVDSDVVFLIDLDLPDTKSVTNDAENVWKEVKTLYPYKRIVYRDSMGRWDEMECGPKCSKIEPKELIKLYNIRYSPYSGDTPEV